MKKQKIGAMIIAVGVMTNLCGEIIVNAAEINNETAIGDNQSQEKGKESQKENSTESSKDKGIILKEKDQTSKDKETIEKGTEQVLKDKETIVKEEGQASKDKEIAVKEEVQEAKDKEEASKKEEQAAKDKEKQSKTELEEIIKITANDSVQRVGEKFNPELLNIKAIDVNNPNTKYEIKVGSYEDSENPINNLMDSKGVFIKEGTGDVVIQVIKKGEVIAEAAKQVKVLAKDAEVNYAPIITGSGLTIKQGKDFDYSMLKITAMDKEDGDLTAKVKIEGKVDTSKPGLYSVTASVEDNNGNKTVEKYTVIVNARKSPEITGVKDFKLTLKVGDKYENSMLKVKATDEDGKDITSKVTYTGKVDTNKAGKYNVVAKVTDENNVTSEKTFTVEVQERKIPEITGVKGFKLVLKVGDKYENSMLKVKATDENGKDITSKVTYTGKVDTSKAGKYNVIAKVTDENNVTSEKTFTVEVQEKQKVETLSSEKPRTGDKGIVLTGILGLASLLGLTFLKKK